MKKSAIDRRIGAFPFARAGTGLLGVVRRKFWQRANNAGRDDILEIKDMPDWLLHDLGLTRSGTPLNSYGLPLGSLSREELR